MVVQTLYYAAEDSVCKDAYNKIRKAKGQSDGV